MVPPTIQPVVLSLQIAGEALGPSMPEVMVQVAGVAGSIPKLESPRGLEPSAGQGLLPLVAMKLRIDSSIFSNFNFEAKIFLLISPASWPGMTDTIMTAATVSRTDTNSSDTPRRRRG